MFLTLEPIKTSDFAFSIHPSPCTGDILLQPTQPWHCTTTVCRMHRVRNFCVPWLALSWFWVLLCRPHPSTADKSCPLHLQPITTTHTMPTAPSVIPWYHPRSEMLHHHLLSALQWALLHALVSTCFWVQFSQGQVLLERSLQYFIQEILQEKQTKKSRVLDVDLFSIFHCFGCKILLPPM